MAEYIVGNDGDESILDLGEFELRFQERERIVRCRDCKHSYEESRCTSIGWVDVLVCESKQWSTSSLMPSHTVDDDGFCAWGERRDE